MSRNNETEAQEVPIPHNTTKVEDAPGNGNVDDETSSDDELDHLTYFLGTRRSVRSTAGVPPEGILMIMRTYNLGYTRNQ